MMGMTSIRPKMWPRWPSGSPLDDTDRAPWLAHLRDLLADHLAKNETAVMACSALKRSYRDLLRGGSDRVIFVYLQGDFDTLWQRMTIRPDHFMKPEMLRSQFETLEPPNPDEALILSVAQPIDAMLAQILRTSQSEIAEEKKMTDQADIGLIGLAVMGQIWF